MGRIRRVLGRIDTFRSDHTGAGMAEYILIIVLIALFLVWSIRMYSGKLRAAYYRAADAIAMNGECCTGHPPYPLAERIEGYSSRPDPR